MLTNWICVYSFFVIHFIHYILYHSIRRGVLYGDDFLTLNHEGPFLSHYTLSCHIPSIEHFQGHDNRENTQKNNNNNNNDMDKGKDFYFDKNEFPKFDPLDCNDGFLFPKYDISTNVVDEGAALCAENVERLNLALCDFYKRKCPSRTRAYQNAVSNCPWDTNAPFMLHHSQVKPSDCGNKDTNYCLDEVANGVCFNDPQYMQLNCLEACGFCATTQPNEGHEGDSCKDLAGTQTCSKLANEMECILNPTYMVVNCRKTCGKCPNRKVLLSESSTSTLGKGASSNEFSGLVFGQDENTMFFVMVLAIAVFLVLKMVCSKCWRRSPFSPRGQIKKST